jgi:hypothetical protein
MLIPATAPAPSLSATVSGGKVILSLPTVTGSTYQVQYKNNITDTGWSSLGSAIVGNGATQSVQDSLAAANRFYRVQILKQP